MAVAARAAGLFTAFVTAGFMSIEALDYVAPISGCAQVRPQGARRAGVVGAEQGQGPGDHPRRRRAGAAGARPARRGGLEHRPRHQRRRGEPAGHGPVGATMRSVPKTPWHVTRFLPDFELSHLPATSIKTLEQAAASRTRGGAAVRVRGQRARTRQPAHGLSAVRTHRHPPGRPGARGDLGARRAAAPPAARICTWCRLRARLSACAGGSRVRRTASTESVDGLARVARGVRLDYGRARVT